MGSTVNMAIVVFLCIIAAMICAIDVRKMIIPDWINALLAISGAFVSIFILRTDWVVVGASALITGLVFLALAEIYCRARGISGLGMGDVKFIAAASTWVGAAGLPWLLLLACIGGLAHVLLRHLSGFDMQRTTRIPFGPYLSLGLVLTWSLGLSV